MFFKGKMGIGTRTASKIVGVSRSSIQRFLKKQPWGSYLTPQKVPGLTEQNIDDRKLFYKRCIRFGLDRVVKHVAFSDEKQGWMHVLIRTTWVAVILKRIALF